MTHQYTVEELNKEYGEAWQEIRNVNDYHVLYEIKNNGNNKHVVIGCSNMLHALKYISGNYYEMLKEKFPTQQLQEWENAVSNAIASIKNEKNDENVNINVLNIETEGNGIIIVNAGYWDSFARITPKLLYLSALLHNSEINSLKSNLLIEMHTEDTNLQVRLDLITDEKLNAGIDIYDNDKNIIDNDINKLQEIIDEKNHILEDDENGGDEELTISDDNLKKLYNEIKEFDVLIDKLKIMIADDVVIYSPEFMINFNNICKEICEQ